MPAPTHHEWVKPGARVVSSCHGPGHITSVYREMIGVHWASSKRNKLYTALFGRRQEKETPLSRFFAHTVAHVESSILVVHARSIGELLHD